MIHSEIFNWVTNAYNRSRLGQWTSYFSAEDREQKDWAIPPDMTFSSLKGLVNFLLLKGILQDPTTLVIADYDKTCRDQDLWKLLFHFGEIRDDEIELLEKIHEQLCQLLILTNQTDFGHVFANIFGHLLHYEYFPKILKEKEIPYLAAPPFHPPLLTMPYKYTQQSVSDTVTFVLENPPKDGSLAYKKVIVVGDRMSDIDLANRLFEFWRDKIDPTILFEAFLLTDHPQIPRDEPTSSLEFQLAT